MSITTKVAPAAGFTAVLSWAWNGVYPGYPMGPEVAAGLMIAMIPIIHWLTAWLPNPFERRDPPLEDDHPRVDDLPGAL